MAYQETNDQCASLTFPGNSLSPSNFTLDPVTGNVTMLDSELSSLIANYITNPEPSSTPIKVSVTVSVGITI
jgi:hypothetical protein